eukprot:CAMPEP_0197522912 /NCGR_PEP_ID=MMETSP1318-20131121/7956_1 /TAXON_ID=552666 /ORGANISM="Partenskyella glossopodia, Strain RCC365" /LENGTH=158 /DNA_ID=CAMNT_0043075439 /DNA_START=179 /DNA_END=655 /DNA_ORIENTATION=+
MEEVQENQKKWAAAIKNMSKVYAEGGDYVQAAKDAAGELYGYGHFEVLFKPTKSTTTPFRPDGIGALSYFVGCDTVGDAGHAEDKGFAINGGRGWSEVEFNNHQIDLNGPVAIAMGSYTFTDATDGGKGDVFYTFGYKRCEDGQSRIFLHHSSPPYVE